MPIYSDRITDEGDDRFGDLCAAVEYDVTDDIWTDGRRYCVECTASLVSVTLSGSATSKGLTLDREQSVSMLGADWVADMEKSFGYRRAEDLEMRECA